MATTQSNKSGSKSKTTKSASSKSKSTTKKTTTTMQDQDAIKILKADHKVVSQWFEEFEKTEDDSEKAKLVEQIVLALKVHTQVEEEIFYPAAREALSDEDLIDEAVVEHAAAKDLMSEIEAMEVGEELYDAKVKVLGEQIEHHVEEEEKEMFPKLQKTDMDMVAIGIRIAERKQELMAKMARPNGKRLQ